MNPFKYRPVHLVRDPKLPDAPDDIEWEDNPISNFMAWFSQTRLLEPMCNEPEYMSSRIAGYLFTSCPCCLSWRWLLVGLFFGGLIGLVIGSFGAWLWL